MLIACSAASAQCTVVQDNGVNGKIEMDYNAAGKVTQTRTIDADGKVRQKVEYEYLPGYYNAQQTDTTYWPTGKVRRVTRTNYDKSSNFTSEFVQAFDEAGRQTAGHKLTYDPWTGVYRCAEWKAAAQDYKAVECPEGEGEEGGGRAEQVKRFTYAEVAKHLAAARNAARSQSKIEHMQPATPVQPPVVIANRTVGLVLPAQFRPGERISGILIEHPEQYEGGNEVTVTRVTVPFEATGEAAQLWGWFFEAPGESPLRADGPITFVVPRGSSTLEITFRQAGNPAHSVSQTLSLPHPQARPKSPKSFYAAAFCLKDGLCTVSGPFAGDSSKTFAAFEDRPAKIVAENSDAAYICIPERTGPGARPLFIAEGSKMVALPVVVGELVLQDNRRVLQPGQSLIMLSSVDGPGEIPESQWRAGDFPTDNLVQARELIPGFQLPSSGRKRQAAAKREDKDQDGEILLVIKNVTPAQISLRGADNEVLIFHLKHEAFARGRFKYNLLVEAQQAGAADVRGYVIPFLAPVAGQEFAIRTTQQKSD